MKIYRSDMPTASRWAKGWCSGLLRCRERVHRRVDFVDPVVQLPGRTITVKAEVANVKRELQAGMFIDARLATDVRPAAIVVPEDAVLPLQGANFVWVAKDGKATRR